MDLGISVLTETNVVVASQLSDDEVLTATIESMDLLAEISEESFTLDAKLKALDTLTEIHAAISADGLNPQIIGFIGNSVAKVAPAILGENPDDAVVLGQLEVGTEAFVKQTIQWIKRMFQKIAAMVADFFNSADKKLAKAETAHAAADTYKDFDAAVFAKKTATVYSADTIAEMGNAATLTSLKIPTAILADDAAITAAKEEVAAAKVTNASGYVKQVMGPAKLTKDSIADVITTAKAYKAIIETGKTDLKTLETVAMKAIDDKDEYSRATKTVGITLNKIALVATSYNRLTAQAVTMVALASKSTKVAEKNEDKSTEGNDL